MKYYKSGDYNGTCDICGSTYKASTMLKTWDGLYVCRKDWYQRQPLDFSVKLKDSPSPPWTRPKGIDVNTSGNELTASGIIQFMNGVANSPAIPNITNSAIVNYSMNYQDGPRGTWTLTIQSGIGFTLTSTSNMELSTVNYSITSF